MNLDADWALDAAVLWQAAKADDRSTNGGTQIRRSHSSRSTNGGTQTGWSGVQRRSRSAVPRRDGRARSPSPQRLERREAAAPYGRREEMFSPAMAKVHVVALVGAFEPGTAFGDLSEREQQRRLQVLTKYLRKLAHALSASVSVVGDYEDVVQTLESALRSSNIMATTAVMAGLSLSSEKLVLSCWSDMTSLGNNICEVVASEPTARRAILDALVSDDTERAALALRCACGLRATALQRALGASAKTVGSALDRLARHGCADGATAADARLLLSSMREIAEQRRTNATTVLGSHDGEGVLAASIGGRLMAWLTRSLHAVSPHSPQSEPAKAFAKPDVRASIIVI